MMRQKTNKKRSQFYEFWLPIHCGRFIDYYDISSSQKVVNFRALKQSKKKVVLACRLLKGLHIYDILSNMIQKIHLEFEIDGKVCMTTTDNGSRFVKAFR